MANYKVLKFASEDAFIAYCFGNEPPPEPEFRCEVPKRSYLKFSDGKRVCSVCKKEKPATRQHFYPNPIVSDGCQSKCKECERIIRRMRKPGKRTLAYAGARLIYFLRVTADRKGLNRVGWIKVGATVNLHDRIRAMRSQEKVDVTILGIINADLEVESAFVDRYLDSTANGREWFHSNGEMISWIFNNTELPKLSKGIRTFKIDPEAVEYHRPLEFKQAA
jgi:hypothetical protein